MASRGWELHGRGWDFVRPRRLLDEAQAPHRSGGGTTGAAARPPAGCRSGSLGVGGLRRQRVLRATALLRHHGRGGERGGSCVGLLLGVRRAVHADLDDAAVKKASIASTRHIIVAANGSKLGHTAYAYVGPSTLLHTLVTDTSAPADEIAALEGTGTVVKAV